MSFHDLQYILAISKHHSITKAANELFLSQSALTKFLQKTERNLGIPLFKRIGNTYALTYAGERYIQYASEILNIKKQMDSELTNIMKKNIGQINVGITLNRGNYMIPNVLPRFKHIYPYVKIHLTENNPIEFEDLLMKGEIDLAFINLPIKNKNIDYKIIGREEVILAVSEHHPLVGDGIVRYGFNHPWVDIRKFKDDGFILPSATQRIRMNIDEIFIKAGFSPNLLIESQNLYACTQLAALGYGVTLTLDTHVKHFIFKKPPKYFSIGSPNSSFDFVVAYRHGIFMPQYMKDFVQIATDTMKVPLQKKWDGKPSLDNF